MQLTSKQQTGKKTISSDTFKIFAVFVHAQLPIWCMLIRQVAAIGTLKIKTLITLLCSLILTPVAVEIFAIGQPCAKIFSKVWCATFFWDTVYKYA